MKKSIFRILACTLLVITAFNLESCTVVYRSIAHGQADVTDHEWQPKVIVEKGTTDFEFAKKTDTELAAFLDKSLEGSNTNAFMVIKNDTIIYEKYFNNYDENSLHTSFSVAKSFVSALVGIAQGEGLLNENEPITTYLPELLKQDKDFEKITVKHLLNMQSGIKFDEYPRLNPFTGMARLYYGTNIRTKITHGMTIEEAPGRFNYRSIDTQVLGVILERVTKMPVEEYLSEKLWKPLEMTSDATWSVDSDRNKMVKAFCGINATAEDFAKLGRLYLNGGKYKGKQIVPAAWVAKTDSGKKIRSHFGYKNKWWTSSHYEIFDTEDEGKAYAAANGKEFISSKKLKSGKYVSYFQGDDYNALGILGQHVYVNPTENIIVVRLGDSWRNKRFYLSELIYTYVGNGRYKKMLPKKEVTTSQNIVAKNN
ncbi:serine hydrolase [Kordia algicida OT-1]|uniref:Beta-lactamase n=1 Tax=Kordia algicida OT-1 TaxID=391587 RepID=A9DJX1_9FLAO|nr:serine hydrolase [Kordia algicida]EDP98206.1 beta-lactamase [Kordia algicida OT-1]